MNKNQAKEALKSTASKTPKNTGKGGQDNDLQRKEIKTARASEAHKASVADARKSHT